MIIWKKEEQEVEYINKRKKKKKINFKKSSNKSYNNNHDINYKIIDYNDKLLHNVLNKTKQKEKILF